MGREAHETQEALGERIKELEAIKKKLEEDSYNDKNKLGNIIKENFPETPADGNIFETVRRLLKQLREERDTTKEITKTHKTQTEKLQKRIVESRAKLRKCKEKKAEEAAKNKEGS